MLSRACSDVVQSWCQSLDFALNWKQQQCLHTSLWGCRQAAARSLKIQAAALLCAMAPYVITKRTRLLQQPTPNKLHGQPWPGQTIAKNGGNSCGSFRGVRRRARCRRRRCRRRRGADPLSHLCSRWSIHPSYVRPSIWRRRRRLDGTLLSIWPSKVHSHYGNMGCEVFT